jgi:hypothetical protein
MFQTSYNYWPLIPLQNYPLYPSSIQQSSSSGLNNTDNKENLSTNNHINLQKRKNPFNDSEKNSIKRARTESVSSFSPLNNIQPNTEPRNSYNYKEANSKENNQVTNLFQNSVMPESMAKPSSATNKENNYQIVLKNENKEENIQIISSLITKVSKPVAGKHKDKLKKLTVDEKRIIAESFLKLDEKHLNYLLYWLNCSYYCTSSLHGKLVIELSRQLKNSHLENNIQLGVCLIKHFVKYQDTIKNEKNLYLVDKIAGSVKSYIAPRLNKESNSNYFLNEKPKIINALIPEFINAHVLD